MNRFSFSIVLSISIIFYSPKGKNHFWSHYTKNDDVMIIIVVGFIEILGPLNLTFSQKNYDSS